MKGTWEPLITQSDVAMKKIVLKRVQIKMERFYIGLIYVHFHKKELLQFLGFANPVVDSDDEDELKDKNGFKLALRLLAIFEISEILETLAQKNLIFYTTAKLNCREL